MTVGGLETAVVHSSGVTRSAEPLRTQFAKLVVGEELRLQVLRRLGGQEYLVAFGGERHLVESAIDLAVGASIRASVTAVGERLTLRYIGDESPSKAQLAAEDMLADLAARHGVRIEPQAAEGLRAAAAASADPARMMMSGLYLAKLGLRLHEQGARALYAAQMDGTAGAAAARLPAVDVPRAQRGPLAADSVDGLLERLDAALGDASFEAAPLLDSAGDRRGADHHHDQQDEAFARRALNVQDGGSVAYRYATLPLLIDGELCELQVALFTPRRAAERNESVRRVVMTLDMPRLRSIRIEARSVGDRIAVSIHASAAAAMQALAPHETAVREVLGQLGWSVEAVSYGVSAPHDRAARRIVDHVLAAETFDESF